MTAKSSTGMPTKIRSVMAMLSWEPGMSPASRCTEHADEARASVTAPAARTQARKAVRVVTFENYRSLIKPHFRGAAVPGRFTRWAG
jgi:hypothetical protein